MLYPLSYEGRRREWSGDDSVDSSGGSGQLDELSASCAVPPGLILQS